MRGIGFLQRRALCDSALEGGDELIERTRRHAQRHRAHVDLHHAAFAEIYRSNAAFCQAGLATVLPGGMPVGIGKSHARPAVRGGAWLTSDELTAAMLHPEPCRVDEGLTRTLQEPR